MFREYHPTWGRWVSPDPAGLAAADPSNPQTWDRYAYVAGSPTSLVDPLGGFACQPNLDNDYCGSGPSYEDGGFGGPDCSVLDGFDCGYNDPYPIPGNTNGSVCTNGSGCGKQVDESGKPLYTQPPPPTCSALESKNPAMFDFVSSNLLDAGALSIQLDISTQDILGLASVESANGTSNLAVNYNNYFGLTKGSAFGNTTGAYHSPNGYTYGVYASPGFLNSGVSFANSFQGARVSGQWDPHGFVTALTTPPLAFNSEPGRFKIYVNRINDVNQLVPCAGNQP